MQGTLNNMITKNYSCHKNNIHTSHQTNEPCWQGFPIYYIMHSLFRQRKCHLKIEIKSNLWRLRNTRILKHDQKIFRNKHAQFNYVNFFLQFEGIFYMRFLFPFDIRLLFKNKEFQ